MLDSSAEEYVLNPDEFAAFAGPDIRARLVEALRFDLLGPESPDEVLSQSPATRYLVGMLAPQGTSADPTEDDTLEAGADSDNASEPAPALSLALTPSSIGLSFVVDPDDRSLEITASWGEYEKREAPEELEVEESGDIDREEDADVAVPKKRRTKHEWVRTPYERVIPLGVLRTGRSAPVDVGEGVQVGWSVRTLGANSVVSVFLVNARRSPRGRRPPDESWLYQPKMAVKGIGAAFRARAVGRSTVDPDPDVASADVIYRKRVEFATGHGVAASWDVSSETLDRATEVRTEVVPTHEVPLVRPLSLSGGVQLSMDALASAEDGAKAAEVITPLLEAYEAWIELRDEEAKSISAPDDAMAASHVRLCRASLRRMEAGLQLLSEDGIALDAFRFANRAMAMQRRRSVMVLTRRRGKEALDQVEPAWRPFQLGFILECLAGIARPEHADRSVADLLWFPTGGGKTEAYLGLTAFTLANRRLRGDHDGLDASTGTSVLMRYTLRLLTIQQFQRATALLCACEVIRAGDVSKWGLNRFTIGLWVGESVTPNRYEEARDNLEKLKRGENVYEGNPYQILYCPWCGEDIQPTDYMPDDDDERLRVLCPNRDCDFHSAVSREGLPALLIDEEIYRNPPSLLLATVDKFAQMAWNGRIQALFGRVDRYCARHGFLTAAETHSASHAETRGSPKTVVQPVDRRLAPPDLVIQDELHLISGPLGTLVGIYESALDGLCSYEVNGRTFGPKVIASTATIRGAHDQIEALFWRKTEVFPPLGLDVADSFFAREDPDSPGRLYLGVFAPGKSIKTALVRTYAVLLSRAPVEFENSRTLGNAALAEADSYMTLVGYFNSLRELGGALRLVDDDVPARMRVLRNRGFGPWRTLFEKEELTSRRQSSQISDILKKMDRTFLTREKGKYPIDVLLASNMISVGVDIDRLGVMVVSAQPKTSAEYIQATSRVGRVHPGLVVEVYNWVRPRDTSHYERFVHYHDTFYRHVEATSVTPFSARARDRALPAVLVSYVRQNDPDLAQEQGANRFDGRGEEVERIVEQISRRAELVSGRAEVGDETRRMLKNLVGEWQALTSDDVPLRYSSRRLKDPDRWTILLRSMEMGSGRGHWRAAGSLREVEPEVDVILLDERDIE